MEKPLQIAIDGPVAAGKSTVAKMLADRLNMLYIDTGAMYRATAYLARVKGVDWNDEEGLVSMLKSTKLELSKPTIKDVDGRKVTVLVDDEDVSLLIRTQDIAEGASVVSQYKKVRELLVGKQQELAEGKRVVMEGRDIGLRVLPNARIKIFMTADVDKRVKWKQQEQRKLGIELSQEEVKEALVKRDKREMTRKVDPLKPVKDAWLFDTSSLTITEVVELIEERVNKLDGKL
jgi:cytidylate kinase